MTNTSPQLTVRPDRPVDPLLQDILRRVDAATRELGIEYFVGGALARDLILLHVFGRHTGRATRDVDLGIHIDDWTTLDALKANLTREGAFSEKAGIAHRLMYDAHDAAFGIPLDLLPFGGVESTDGTIAWPPGMEILMSVAGFAEARQSAMMVGVADDLCVPVASLPALAMLKLIAWRDRHRETTKDAADFLLIARHYCDAGNIDRLYDAEPVLLQAADFDPELAGAILLGKDAAEISLPRTTQAVTVILTDAGLRQQLIGQLLRTTLSMGDDAGSSRVERYLNAFQSGLTTVAAKQPQRRRTR
ncbi:Predicted nucleotidyltransferase [Aromatoleum tolulyticum]|uniref:Predicted nucleotidyltransferase n=1 Tax=Aromatoleum tolulyticum TaxID=34027 RepID=A0A1N7B1L0_9RHOO|nr:nucleotidyl transferase AbiEii/AbiGii toxin family protein [Aromatoleum tolulyticum]SIR45230.1 Predicted nucleotidyltransferase [Aromatoleum tolulyticum]